MSVLLSRLLSLILTLIQQCSRVVNSISATCTALHRSLIQLVVSLGELHTTIRTPRTPLGSGSGSGSTPSSALQEDLTGSAGSGMGMDGDKGERRAKIRELVDEVGFAYYRLAQCLECV